MYPCKRGRERDRWESIKAEKKQQSLVVVFAAAANCCCVLLAQFYCYCFLFCFFAKFLSQHFQP